ncbi:hypothetical protein VNI00_018566 [Paramarasmius palmivorus]|uniref:Uncharacterized protein n=1 Tax=Paramarasmius palmivorus TaxID=297713 RepID=A0AAW0AZ86_9AGAR
MGKKKTSEGSEEINNSRSWPKGPKLEMLKRYEQMYHQDRSAMYNHATDEFLATWGYNLLPEDLPEPGVDYAPPDINTFAKGTIRGEEVKRRAKRRKAVKKRIINWASYRFRLKYIKSDAKLVGMISKTVRDLREEVPRKKTDVQRYQELYYQDRVKEEFDTYWEGGAKDMIDGDYKLSEMNKYSKSKWEMEDEEFIREVREENARIYAADLQKYTERGKWSGTAEDFSDAWLRSKTVIAAVADALAKHFGVAVILLAAGPRDDGVIRTESITSIVPTSQTNDSFQTFNPEKCKEIHEHCTEFAKHVFLQSECESRIFKRGANAANSSSKGDYGSEEGGQVAGWERFSVSDDSTFKPAACPMIRPFPAEAVQNNVASVANPAPQIDPVSLTPQPSFAVQPAPQKPVDPVTSPIQSETQLPPVAQPVAQTPVDPAISTPTLAIQTSVDPAISVPVQPIPQTPADPAVSTPTPAPQTLVNPGIPTPANGFDFTSGDHSSQPSQVVTSVLQLATQPLSQLSQHTQSPGTAVNKVDGYNFSSEDSGGSLENGKVLAPGSLYTSTPQPNNWNFPLELPPNNTDAYALQLDLGQNHAGYDSGQFSSHSLGGGFTDLSQELFSGFDFNDPSMWEAEYPAQRLNPQQNRRDLNSGVPDVPMAGSGLYNSGQFVDTANATFSATEIAPIDAPKKRKRRKEEDALIEYAEDILARGENGVKRPRRSATAT